MRRAISISALVTLLAVGWLAYDFVIDRAPPHRFEVTLDEPAKAARLTLGNSNGDVTTAMNGGPTEFTASRNVADSSGTIRIEWLDGSATECIVGYVTNGETEPHVVTVDSRRCPEVGGHVQY